MLSICTGYSINYERLINEVLGEIVGFFIEFGGNLPYDEIYASVFPAHMRDNEESIKAHLKKLYRNITDNYIHTMTSLDEYTLYCIICDCAEDEFEINDIISEKLKSNKYDRLDNEEKESLVSTDTSDLAVICFEDTDFLEVGMYVDWFKTNPYLVKDHIRVDLDYYKEIMPEDILNEYEKIKNDRQKLNKVGKVVINNPIESSEEFYKIVLNGIISFKETIVHKQLHKIINKEQMQATEKDVQILFNALVDSHFKHYDMINVREADTGRGTVDFYISHGVKYRALIEFKLASNSQKLRGLLYQLPMYLIAEKMEFGIFVLICYTKRQYDEAYELYEVAESVSKRENRKIEFIRIDATGDFKTASKIRKHDELKDCRDL